MQKYHNNKVIYIFRKGFKKFTLKYDLYGPLKRLYLVQTTIFISSDHILLWPAWTQIIS